VEAPLARGSSICFSLFPQVFFFFFISAWGAIPSSVTPLFARRKTPSPLLFFFSRAATQDPHQLPGSPLCVLCSFFGHHSPVVVFSFAKILMSPPDLGCSLSDEIPLEGTQALRPFALPFPPPLPSTNFGRCLETCKPLLDPITPRSFFTLSHLSPFIPPLLVLSSIFLKATSLSFSFFCFFLFFSLPAEIRGFCFLVSFFLTPEPQLANPSFSSYRANRQEKIQSGVYFPPEATPPLSPRCRGSRSRPP